MTNGNKYEVQIGGLGVWLNGRKYKTFESALNAYLLSFGSDHRDVRLLNLSTGKTEHRKGDRKLDSSSAPCVRLCGCGLPAAKTSNLCYTCLDTKEAYGF